MSGKTFPIEIKASEMVQSKFFDTLTWFKQVAPDTEESVVIYAGDQNQHRTAGRVISWKHVDTVVNMRIKEKK